MELDIDQQLFLTAVRQGPLFHLLYDVALKSYKFSAVSRYTCYIPIRLRPAIIISCIQNMYVHTLGKDSSDKNFFNFLCSCQNIPNETKEQHTVGMFSVTSDRHSHLASTAHKPDT